MAVSGISKASLLGETLKEIKINLKVLAPRVLLFTIAEAAVQIPLILSITQMPALQQLQNDPQFAANNPAAATEVLHQVLGLFSVLIPLIIFISSVGVYYFTVSYLRVAVKKSPPNYSVKNFFHWFCMVAWKSLRPILWNLIPVAGVFIYLRSLIRYQVVGPLAIFGRSPELKRSWDLTKGNVWRILLNQIGLVIIVALAIYLPVYMLLKIVGNTSIIFKILSGIVAAFQGSFMVMVSAVYSCTVYRILLSEQRQQAPAVGAPSTLNTSS